MVVNDLWFSYINTLFSLHEKKILAATQVF